MTGEAAALRVHSGRSANIWEPTQSEIVIGKDVLELISSSMYVDPITIFREYIQNAADSVDEARRLGFIQPDERGVVEITLDTTARSIRIRDNGAAIPAKEFERRLLAIGASTKRGTTSRGFRGVGRLAGLGYCQELIFRTRADGDLMLSELRWDARALRTNLREASHQGGLVDLARSVTESRQFADATAPRRFFEVELKGVVRHRNDRLLSPVAVASYLAQVAPVPFSPDFSRGFEISKEIANHVSGANLHVKIAGLAQPVFRPHSNSVQIGEHLVDQLKAVEFHQIPSVDGGVAAIAWVAHHGYVGAIPSSSLVKGLRLRCGDIQVGEANILEELFAEPRFNGWSIGEVHVLDRRIVPNGRRDHFEQNVHFDNLLNHIAPIARDISRRCRSSSIERKLFREFKLQEDAVAENFAIVRQGGLGPARRTKVLSEINRTLHSMDKVAQKLSSKEDPDGRDVTKVLEKLRTKFQKAGKDRYRSAFQRLPKKKREIYEQVIALIYECSANRGAAKSLVDRLLHKLQ